MWEPRHLTACCRDNFAFVTTYPMQSVNSAFWNSIYSSSKLFWVMTSCTLETEQHFEWTYHLLYRLWRWRQFVHQKSLSLSLSLPPRITRRCISEDVPFAVTAVRDPQSKMRYFSFVRRSIIAFCLCFSLNLCYCISEHGLDSLELSVLLRFLQKTRWLWSLTFLFPFLSVGL
jgi:hypothetical protein